MQRMFLAVSNSPVRGTGSKKALYFIHNDTPKLSPPKYFDHSKNKTYSATFPFCRAILGRYLQREFEMLKNKYNNNYNNNKNKCRAIKSNMNTYQNMSEEWEKRKKKEQKSNQHKSVYYRFHSTIYIYVCKGRQICI